MAMKPVDKRSPEEKREAVWAVIRQMRQFCVRDLYMEVRLGKETIRDYVAGLTAAGYLEKIREAHLSQPALYRLVKDCGPEAPRVRKDGTPVTMGLGRELMWRTMRILKEFSPQELAITASIEGCEIAVGTAKDYIHHLARAGYLAVSQPAGPGTQARYRFLPSRYTGPKPPQVQRVKTVYDPNLGKVVWSSREVAS